jgi:glucan 1,3-beta-glucosidase
MYDMCDAPMTDNRAIASMRQVSPAAASFPLYIHDGFDLDRFSLFVANRKDFVVQDHHSYFVYSPSDDAKSASQHAADIGGDIAFSFAKASSQSHRNVVIDEWSCALTPNSLAQEFDPVAARKQFCTGQMEVYNQTAAGWSFWCTFTVMMHERYHVHS